MAVPEEKFRLGDMLSLTLRAPLSFRWPVTEDRAARLAVYMTEGRLDPFNVDKAVDRCADELRRQHPWLAGIDIPGFVRESHDWATLWAWLDTLERKYGVWHEVQAALREFGLDSDS